LDDIPTPSAGPAMSGLGMSMMPRVKAQSAAQDSPLRASLHKEKSLSSEGTPAEQEASASTASTDMSPLSTGSNDVTEAASTPQESEEEAKAKLERALATKEKDSQISDYIFALPNMDPRILGRIVNWVEEIEKKDKYLTAHATTVAEYSCAIAEQLKLSPREIEDIKVAALLHDVGKLGTSAEILQKRDEDLDDAELLTIMRHPMDGAELLKSVPDLVSFASIVLAHHEEYGGNGYPQGLKGEEIPLPARIIFTANSYHGMVSDTCYGKGISAEDAQKQLREGAGQQYDPTVVEAFISYFQKTTQ
jgi:putative nucleotidyltransferase with HDIG domain